MLTCIIHPGKSAVCRALAGAHLGHPFGGDAA
jgi:hypothetical protein